MRRRPPAPELPAAPSSPPLLVAMGARKEQLEAARSTSFATWKAALETAHGNVSHAAKALGLNRNRGNKLTVRFELVAYGAALRTKYTGRSIGRPYPKER